MDSACGLSGADCFRQWQDTSQLQSRSLSKQMCPKSYPAPYASWALQIQVKYSRPGFCASGFISTINVLLVLICKGMHLWDNMVFYVILQEFWLSETFQTSNTGLVPENCHKLIKNETHVHTESSIYEKYVVIHLITWYILADKELFKLANVKQTAKLLLVTRLTISYFESTLKKYLYVFLTSKSSILVHLYLPWTWATSTRWWGKAKQYSTKFCNTSSSEVQLHASYCHLLLLQTSS